MKHSKLFSYLTFLSGMVLTITLVLESTKPGYAMIHQSDDCHIYKLATPQFLYSNIRKTIYLKEETILYQEASESSARVHKAIPYKQYQLIGIGKNGWDQIEYENEILYVIHSLILFEKPSVPNTIVDKEDSLYTYSDMQKDLKALTYYYPDYVQMDVIGKSFDQRNLYRVILGNPDAKKQILIQASMHAREYINTQVLMLMLEYYAKNYETGSYQKSDYKSLFSDVSIHIIPMVNPDGVMISQFGYAGIKSERIQTHLKPLLKDTSSKRWKSNANGVDLNRNFPYRWNENPKSNTYSSMLYPGPSRASEPETQALMAYTKTLTGLQAAISYHSSGSIMYWDFDQKGLIREQCYDLVQQVQSINGYPPYIKPKNSECTYGGYSDWVVFELNIPAITIETGVSTAPVDVKELDTILRKNQDILPMLARFYQ